MKNTAVLGIMSLVVLSLMGCGQVKFSSNGNSNEKPGPGSADPISPSQTQEVTYKGSVEPKNNKVDILLVVDDSNSMLADNKKLADRLAGFVTSLQNSKVDWQMCVTLTRQLTVNENLYWGASVNWFSYTPAGGTPQWILKSSASNLSTVFNSTIDKIGAGWAGTDDERGIKAAFWHIDNSRYNSCYRSDAALSVIIISDEDERSVGGDSASAYYANEYKALEDDDKPQAFVNKVKSVLGDNKRFTVNSIIVKDGDSGCMQNQDSAGSKSHYGKLYQELSGLTGGGVGSICETDYGANLNYFKEIIQTSLASLPLQCPPIDNQINVTITPPLAGAKSTIQGSNLIFNPEVPAGSTVELRYRCETAKMSVARAPSSEPTLWMRIWNWVKSYFN